MRNDRCDESCLVNDGGFGIIHLTILRESVWTMDFNEKLQELRKQKGLTQEELAQTLYVSRTAVSKWESGRGYPNIDSLKALATYFSVSVDDLLSGDQLLAVAQEETHTKTTRIRDLVFGLLDLSVLLLLFLPFFGEKVDGMVREVSLLALTSIALPVRILYWVVVVGTSAFGMVTWAIRRYEGAFWLRYTHLLSLLWSGAGVLLFILSPQPYAAALLFVFFAIKVILFMTQKASRM